MRAASLENRRLKPNHYSYGGALQACRIAAAEGDAAAAASALGLLQGMKKDGVRANQRCSLAAFSAVASAGREDDAAVILEDMLEAKLSTSEGALVSARESMLETLEGGGGGGGGEGEGEEGKPFARAMAAFAALERAQEEKAAEKAARAAAAV